MPPAARPLAIGDPAPAFTLPDAEGTPRTLSEFLGKRVVLYFYPKDNTPGCTKEACSFQRATAALAKEHAVVLGVSCDDARSHQRFAKTFHLTFPLLSDRDGSVCTAYGVYQSKSMFGRSYWGIERTTVIIDERGRIAALFPRVRVLGHTAEVLTALRTLRRPATTPA